MLGKQLNSLQFRGEVWAGVTIVEFGDMKKESESGSVMSDSLP